MAAHLISKILVGLLNFAQPLLLNRILAALQEAYDNTPRPELVAGNNVNLFTSAASRLYPLAVQFAGDFGLVTVPVGFDDDVARNARQMAYIFAFLSFLCQILRTEADLQSQSLMRRAAVR